jgi:hypothetical protein
MHTDFVYLQKIACLFLTVLAEFNSAGPYNLRFHLQSTKIDNALRFCRSPSERNKRVALEGVGPSYLVGGGWSVLAPSANDVLRMPHTTSSCIDLYQK